MNPTQGPGPHPATEVRSLLELAQQGATANDRPDLTTRLAATGRILDAATAPVEQERAVRAAAAETLRAVGSLEIDLRARRAALGDPGRAARLQAELLSAEARAERFAHAAREWPHLFGEGFAGVASDSEFHVRAMMRAIVADAEIDVRTGKGTRDADRLEAWLRGRLEAEADLAYEQVHAGVRGVSAMIAAHLGLAPAQPVPPLPAAPAGRLVSDLPARRSVPAGSSLPSRLLTVLMPGYGGIMMALVVSRFLGLDLPTWVILTCAAAGALALGGAAASGERARQRDRRAAEAMTMVRAMVEDFQLTLSKQLRDATRVLQQDLRRRTTDLVARHSVEVSEERDRVGLAAVAAGRAPDDLRDIDDDLAALAGIRTRAAALLRRDSPARPGRNLSSVA